MLTTVSSPAKAALSRAAGADEIVLYTEHAAPARHGTVEYFLLADHGIGAGWDTTQTPNPSNMGIKSINAGSVPGF